MQKSKILIVSGVVVVSSIALLSSALLIFATLDNNNLRKQLAEKDTLTGELPQTGSDTTIVITAPASTPKFTPTATPTVKVTPSSSPTPTVKVTLIPTPTTAITTLRNYEIVSQLGKIPANAGGNVLVYCPGKKKAIDVSCSVTSGSNLVSIKSDQILSDGIGGNCAYNNGNNQEISAQVTVICVDTN